MNKKYKNKREAKKAWNKMHYAYVKENLKCVNLRFHIEKDAEVLAKLEQVENKTDYVRNLILEDLRNEKDN